MEVKMDLKTLQALLKEAKKNDKNATKLFSKYDNSDDMHDMQRWRSTVLWLEYKISSLKKK